MPYTDDATLLQQVRDALVAILERGAKSYQINLPGGGVRSFTALDLDELRKWEADLIARVERADSGGFSVARLYGVGR